MRTNQGVTFPEETLLIRRREDPVVESLGHRLCSAYVETYWLPTLGPSATLLLRRLSLGLDRQPNGYTIDLASLSLALGLGTRGGKHSPLWRSIERICRFDVAARNGNILAVRQAIAPLQRRHIERLPPDLQDQHKSMMAR